MQAKGKVSRLSAILGGPLAVVASWRQNRFRIRRPSPGTASELTMTAPKPGPRIAITYCSMCNWLLRSAWMAQELLQTFGQDLGEVVLIPRTGGIFQIHYDGDLIWDRTVDGGFPDVKQLKQRVRDRLDPERYLGHLDDHKKKLVQS
jgi:selenoprotein W-related protein